MLEHLNEQLRHYSQALFDCLSPVGRAAIYPRDIPFQADQARGAELNATIGQMTDGAGHVLQLPSVAAALSGLESAERNRALSYSPVGGVPELRRSWDRWQRPDSASPTSLPLVTAGLTHGLALCADLFGGPGRKVLMPSPGWGNYRQVFGLRTGAEMVEVPSYEGTAWQPEAMARALVDLEPGEPACVLINLPSNPGGYMPTEEERTRLVQSLCEQADQRPLVVVCDDAYDGLVHDQGIPRGSLFWDLRRRHPRLVAVRAAGSTKELSFFGGRVGFLTFDVDPESEAAAAVESKLLCLVRAGIGSPPALSQMVLLAALQSDSVSAEVQALRERMAVRHRVLVAALEGLEERSSGRLRALPSNAGVFALLELVQQQSAEELRQRLLAEHSTGVIAIGDRFIRLAYCSVRSEALAEVVERVLEAVNGASVSSVG